MSQGTDGLLVRMAAIALSLARRRVASYGSVKSRHNFTQPQLIACPVLKDATRNDYRGVAELLELSPRLRETIGLGKVPHWTTLQDVMARPGTAAVVRS